MKLGRLKGWCNRSRLVISGTLDITWIRIKFLKNSELFKPENVVSLLLNYPLKEDISSLIFVVSESFEATYHRVHVNSATPSTMNRWDVARKNWLEQSASRLWCLLNELQLWENKLAFFFNWWVVVAKYERSTNFQVGCILQWYWMNEWMVNVIYLSDTQNA